MNEECMIGRVYNRLSFSNQTKKEEYIIDRMSNTVELSITHTPALE